MITVAEASIDGHVMRVVLKYGSRSLFADWSDIHQAIADSEDLRRETEAVFGPGAHISEVSETRNGFGITISRPGQPDLFGDAIAVHLQYAKTLDEGWAYFQRLAAELYPDHHTPEANDA